MLSATGRECDQAPAGLPWLDVPRCTDITKARGYTETYAYDSVGSMLQLQHQNVTGGFGRTFAVNAANNRITSLQVGQTSYAYTFDPSGNMTSETASRHFEWNYANQMKAFATQTDGAEPSIYAQYLYDSSGQRVKKLVRNQGGQTETTHYIDGIFEDCRWGSGAQGGENNRVHVMDDKQRIALARIGPAHPDDTGPAIQYHLADHLGSSNVVVDSTGTFFNREEFSPYGETSFGSFAKKRYRFTGQERDEESGFNYHASRYFCSWLSRWASCDPLGHRAGQNLYSYLNDSPLVRIDPSGKQPQPPPSSNNLGNVAPMNKQPRAGRDSSGSRTTENEHVIPNASSQAVTHDANAATSDYGPKQYKNDMTVQIERSTALNKTHANRGGATADNARSARLTAKAQDSTPINYRQEVFLDSLENAHRAARETNSCVPEYKFNEAALAQDANLFALHSTRQSGQILANHGYSLADDPATLEFDIAKPTVAGVSNAASASSEGLSPSLVSRWTPSPTSVASALHVAGWAEFSYELGTAKTPTQAVEAVTNFSGAYVGSQLGAGAGAAIGFFLGGPPGEIAGQGAGSFVGGYVGSKTTEIAKDTDWNEVAFIAAMVMLAPVGI